MFMNQIMFLILENVLKFVKVSTNLRNVYDFQYVHEFKKMAWFQEMESDSVSCWCNKMWSWQLKIIFFFSRCNARALLLVILIPLLVTGQFKSAHVIPDKAERCHILQQYMMCQKPARPTKMRHQGPLAT